MCEIGRTRLEELNIFLKNQVSEIGQKRERLTEGRNVEPELKGTFFRDLCEAELE